MQIYQEQVQSKTQGKTPITIIKLVGDMDGSNYLQVSDSAQKACSDGALNLLLDISEMSFMSSSGLVALHSIALLIHKQKMPDIDDGWNALTAMQDFADGAKAPEKHIKLLNPQPRVLKTLQQVGFDSIFEIFTDREAALAAFG